MNKIKEENQTDPTHEEDDGDEEILGSKTAIFNCPNCGKLNQDEVIFNCNKCDQGELIFKEGVYMCPQCLAPGENFECFTCGSKKVTLSFVKEQK